MAEKEELFYRVVEAKNESPVKIMRIIQVELPG